MASDVDTARPGGLGVAFAPASREGRIRPRTRTWWLPAAFLLAAGAAAVLALSSRSPEPPAAPPTPVPAVVGLGYLEPATTVVRVGATGSPDGSKVAALLVDEGDTVGAGQVLAVLDTAPRLEAQVAAAEAQVQLKRVQYERQRLDFASSMASRRAALERARAELALSASEHERQRSLLAGQAVARSTYDKALRDDLNARATAAETEAALRRLEATAPGPDGTPGVQVDLAVTQAELRGAEADLRTARASLAEASVRAPFAGRVLLLHARAGERIGSDGLLEMGDVAHMRAVVEVYQADVARVAVGDAVKLRADALPGPVRGVAQRVGTAVQRQTVVNNDPAAATDARVVQVFVVLDADASRALAALSRLQVQAVFRP